MSKLPIALAVDCDISKPPLIASRSESCPIGRFGVVIEPVRQRLWPLIGWARWAAAEDVAFEQSMITDGALCIWQYLHTQSGRVG